MISSGESICSKCKGRLWCGKAACPMLTKFYSLQRTLPLLDTEMEGSSPPGVFIGRSGYPKVIIGPLIPPQLGDTTILDTPELWVSHSITDICNFRFSLVRGKIVADVKSAATIDTGGAVKNERLITATRELALASNPADVDAVFDKRPSGRFVGGDEVQPFGPSAPIAKFDVTSLKIDRKIDRVHSDTDMKAVDAVLDLYNKGVLISRIQKAFSVGALGIGKRRRFVPTRWSITAVDDTIGKSLIQKTKTYPIINEFRVYEHEQLDNRWIVMMPREWCFELIEAWYPGTLWNPSARIEIFGDHEFFDGRKEYAEIGGCYYASRMAVNELLNAERRQAGVCVWREAHPGYIMPVGVWNVREAVRAAVKKEPSKFATLDEALQYISKKFDIPLKRWIETSTIVKDTMRQRKLSDFVRLKQCK
ncbi:MAG: Nre family DNA repair protein [Candidatus Aenigmatarchaeota archaeon]